MGKVMWSPWVLNKWIIPKQAFLCWLIAHQRLTTQDRLYRMHIIQSNLCFLCGSHEESHEHLFFSCAFSQRCRDLIANWCLIELPCSEVIKWWVQRRDHNACRKKITAVILASIMYNIWNVRNVSRVEGFVSRPECILQRVKNEVKMRVGQLQINSRNPSALAWISYIRQH
ncbi:uncharacterized protein LOC141607361 [Silene latifolia]|uniref:uncharacterized protein LOC141607361 n=1 Tax=Silene latifolia TaxID=37657 RepID=UPI003D771936